MMMEKKKNTIDRFSQFVTSHKLGVLILTLIVAVMFAAGIFRMKGEINLEEMLPYEHPYLQVISKFSEVFGSGGGGVAISINARKGDIFTPRILERIIRINEEVELWNEVFRVLTVSIGSRLVKVAKAAAGGTIEAETLMWPDAPHDREDIEQLKKDIFSSPTIRGIVAADGTAAVIATEFKREVSCERAFELLRGLQNKYDDDEISLQVVGFPMLMGWIYSYKMQIIMAMAVSVALMVIMLALVFQNFIGMVVPIAFGLISTAMGLGFIGWTGINFSPLLYVLAFLVAARMVSHAVQITHRYMEEFALHYDRNIACFQTVRAMLIPNWAGVATDAAGFFILILVKIALMQQVAYFMTFWMLTVALSGVMTPVLCSYMPLKKAADAWVKKSKETGLLDRICVGAAHYSVGRGRWVVSACVFVALILFAHQAGHLSIGDPTPGSPLLWPNHPYNQAINNLNEKFDFSAESLVLYYEGEEDSVYNPNVLITFELFDRHMRQYLPDIYKSSDSFAGLMKTINMLMFDGDMVRYELPADRESIRGLIGWTRQNTDVYTMRRYIDDKRQMAKTTIHFSDHTSKNLLRIRDAASRFFEEHPQELENGKFILAGGTLGMEIAVNEEMMRTHATVDTMVLSVIFLICALFYRSIVAGLMFTLPLVLANLTAFAYMGLNNIGLSINTLPVAAVGVGVGVDFSIYIYNRCIEEFPKEVHTGNDGENDHWIRTIVKALRTSGKAVIFTGMTMVLPILAWWFISDLKFQAQMGMFLSIILCTNVLLSLTLHPLMICIIKPRFISRKVNRKEIINSITAPARSDISMESSIQKP